MRSSKSLGPGPLKSIFQQLKINQSAYRNDMSRYIGSTSQQPELDHSIRQEDRISKIYFWFKYPLCFQFKARPGVELESR